MAAVGQSITTVTPVAMARSVAAVANGGKVYNLRLIDSIISPDGEVLSESTPILASEIEGDGGSGISGGAAARHERRY